MLGIRQTTRTPIAGFISVKVLVRSTTATLEKFLSRRQAYTQEGTAVDLRTGELWYLKLLNNVQAEIHKNGTYDILEKKYFTFEVDNKKSGYPPYRPQGSSPAACV